MKSTVLLIAAAMSAPPPSPALRFGHLTLEDGLSHSWVRAILKDSRGFLWVGTEGCLDRYDGRAFRAYCPDEENPHALAARASRALFEDREGRLWVGTDGAVHLYDPDRDRFSRFRLEKTGEAPAVRSIAEDDAGLLWIGTERGLYRFDPQGGHSIRFRHDPGDPHSLSDDAVKEVHVDLRGDLWIGTARGLDRWDAVRQRFEHPFAAGEGPQHLDDGVEALYEDENGDLWIGGFELIRYHPDDGTIEAFGTDPGDPAHLGGARVLELCGDRNGRVFIGAENGGLRVLELASGRFSRHVPDPGEPDSLGSTSIWSLSYDDQGILWVGTFNAGLDYVSPLMQRFGVIRARRGGLSDPHVSALLEDRQGTLWIGTDGGGLNRLDRRTGSFEHYRHVPGDPSSLASDAVMALHEDRTGRIWVGTYAGGLQQLDPQAGRFRNVPRELGSGRHGLNVWTIAEARDGTLLVGTERGVGTLEPTRGALVPLSPDLPIARISAIAEDDRGVLWFGLVPMDPEDVRQLIRLERSTGAVTRIRVDPEVEAAKAKGVTDIHVDDHGRLWIGSAGNGLVSLDAGGGERRLYARAEGLPSANVTGVLEDGSGHLWIGTDRGLARMENAIDRTENPRIAVFDARDGLPGLEFNKRAAFLTGSGEMLFGSQRGVSLFRPGRIELDGSAPQVALTGLRILNRPAEVGGEGSPLDRVLSATDRLVLSHDQNVVTFEFAALDYRLPGKNRFAYMLEGIDEDWTFGDTERTATYARLPPGSYVFRVRASNGDGVWNDEGATLAVEIAPPLWGRWSIRILGALLLGGGLAAAYRRRAAAAAAREEMIRRLAYEDPLTGLPNRRLFQDRLAQALAQARRTGARAAVLFLDLDRFKLINDTSGHATGDAVLKAASGRIRSCVRATDTVARLGGDEFLVLLPEVKAAEDALAVASKIVVAFRRPFDFAEGDVYSTVSIGIALFPEDADEEEELVRNADAALYAAKLSGRDGTASYADAPQTASAPARPGVLNPS